MSGTERVARSKSERKTQLTENFMDTFRYSHSFQIGEISLCSSVYQDSSQLPHAREHARLKSLSVNPVTFKIPTIKLIVNIYI
ncbi:unnamed protein product [Allacma fusca]|uniref:Uncharacterized protein n=1 Tax=Allacma fusca TaxID=39272 RepID=A0A8J2LID6_9HEXA|nr:unnamed protein product [Allacma fusca]